MRRIFISLLITFLVLFSGIPFSVSSSEIDDTVDYLLFFKNQQELTEKMPWIHDLKKWDHRIQTNLFHELSVCQIVSSRKTIQFIQNRFPEISCYPNISFSVSPIEKQNNLTRSSKDIPWNIESIHANWLWEKGFTGKKVHLGVLDTGVDGNHKDLKNKILNFAYIDRTGSVFRDPNTYDTDTHGTHVCGIVAGGSVQNPLGVSPDSTLSVGVVIPGGGGSFSQIIGGLEWIINPDQDLATNDSPKAVNLSLGAPGYVPIWSEVLKKLLEHNVLPVFSAGNDGDGISSNPGNTPLSFCSGAVDANDRIATFSSGSENINWEDDIVSQYNYTKPDVSAPGVRIVSSIPDNRYASMSGTSMAAPHLTGSIGLLSEAFPDMSAYDLRAYIESSSVDLGVPGHDSRYGKGKLDLKRTYERMSMAKKISGSIQMQPKWSMKWREINRPVYIDQKGRFISYIDPGSYHLDIYWNQELVKTVTLDHVEKDRDLSIIKLPDPEEITIEGRVMDTLGNPLPATISTSKESTQTDNHGFFSIASSLYETIDIISSGYMNETITINQPQPFLNVKLRKADLLLMEGHSLLYTVKNPPRFSKPYYSQALDDLGIHYAFIKTRKIPLTWEIIKDYPIVLAYYPSGSITTAEADIMAKYLESGGKMILSGRLLLYIQQYYGHDFIQKYFGVSSKYTISSPSVLSFSKSGPFSGFFFSLTGDGGANNQENCEMLIKAEDGKTITPLLQYNETAKDSYAAISISTDKYRGILLGFGFEGINHPASRLEWMRAMMSWINDTHTVHIQFQDKHSPHYFKIVKDTQPYIEKVIYDQEIMMKNLEDGDYNLSLHTYGFQQEHFSFSLKSGDYYSIRSYPKPSPLVPVKLQFDSYLDNPIYYQLYFYDSIIKEDITTSGHFTDNLPTGIYTIKAYVSTLEPILYKWTITNQPVEMKLDFKAKKRKVLLVNDSKTGDYFLDNYIKLGDFYEKFFTSNPNGVDFWDASLKGFPTKLDLLPYQVVYYFSGINQNALHDPATLPVLGFYLDQGGSMIMNGNCLHSNLKGSAFLKKYFGIDIESTNIREQTIIGASNTVMEGFSFDLIDSMRDSGIITPFPSLTVLDDTAVPVFTYVSGKVSSTFYEKENFNSLYITFGLDNISKTANRIDLVNKFIQLALNGI